MAVERIYVKLLNNGEIIDILYLSWIFSEIILNYGHLMAVRLFFHFLPYD